MIFAFYRLELIDCSLISLASISNRRIYMFLMCIYSVVLGRAARSTVGSHLYDTNSKSDARIRITVLLALHNASLGVYEIDE